MGRLVAGQWTTDWYDPDQEGRFVRPPTRFRDWVRAAEGDTVARPRDPRREATSPRDLPAALIPEPDRYHLYVSYACPWAHRTLIVRALAHLEPVIGISVVDHFMGSEGWRFDPEVPGATADLVLGTRYLRDVYVRADPEYTGRVTVPVLWDRVNATIVNNESREIIRMLDHEFASLAGRPVDLCPPALRDRVDAVIDAIYEPINNGVYKAGFATTQRAYDEAVTGLFAALDHWDAVLETQRWLAGEQLTEADVCLFTTLIRFDLVYHTHFKCNKKRIIDYPNLWGFVRELYRAPGVAGTCNFEHIRKHYYGSHESINPHRIVAIGPDIEALLSGPHGRERVPGQAAADLLG